MLKLIKLEWKWIYVLCVGTKQGYGVVWNGT